MFYLSNLPTGKTCAASVNLSIRLIGIIQSKALTLESAVLREWIIFPERASSYQVLINKISLSAWPTATAFDCLRSHGSAWGQLGISAAVHSRHVAFCVCFFLIHCISLYKTCVFFCCCFFEFSGASFSESQQLEHLTWRTVKFTKSSRK